MDQITRRALLFDFYGSLLTPKQQEIYDLYFQQDLSLGEIAQLQEVSRQAVFDLLKRTEEALNSYENKLGLVQKHCECKEIIGQLKEELLRLEEKVSADNFNDIRELFEKLENYW